MTAVTLTLPRLPAGHSKNSGRATHLARSVLSGPRRLYTKILEVSPPPAGELSKWWRQQRRGASH
ncbi:hypothetical protein E2C01_059737 [Portunus trituberculatus]|uniref:Uncharacterized protein n=1 Tax=Portunus trituberculatus TaxID=210409 RepID=A0A5B7H060_PORTR|nr:hypothetical protein [Portunus trituberculatus]